MRNGTLIFTGILALSLINSCGTKKNLNNISHSQTNTYKNKNSLGYLAKAESSRALYAENFLGTPYRFGGSSKTGIDCSGFVCEVFKNENKILPRRSEDQSKIGQSISLSQVLSGDLLFFSTSGGNRISHVGIVHHITTNEVFFIHASTSKGVIISSLNETYWSKAFRFAKRQS